MSIGRFPRGRECSSARLHGRLKGSRDSGGCLRFVERLGCFFSVERQHGPPCACAMIGVEFRETGNKDREGRLM